MLTATSARTIILSVSPSLDSSSSVPSSPATTQKPSENEVLRKLNEHLMKNLSPTFQFMNHPIKFEGKIPIIKKSPSLESPTQSNDSLIQQPKVEPSLAMSSPTSAVCVNFNTSPPNSVGSTPSAAKAAAAYTNNSSQHNSLNTTIVYKAIGGGTTTLSPIPVTMKTTTSNNIITTTDGTALCIKNEVIDSEGSVDGKSEIINTSQSGGTGTLSAEKKSANHPLLSNISSKHQELHDKFVHKFTDFFKSYGSDNRINLNSLNIRSSEVAQSCLNNVSKPSGTKEVSRTNILRLFRIPKIPKEPKEQKRKTKLTPTIIEKITLPIVPPVKQIIPSASINEVHPNLNNEVEMLPSYVTEPNWNTSNQTSQQIIRPVDLSQYSTPLTDSNEENKHLTYSFSDPVSNGNFIPYEQFVASDSMKNLRNNSPTSPGNTQCKNNSVS